VQDAKDVAAGEGAAVRLRPAAAHQFGEQGRIGADVLQALGDFCGAVEVTADADVLDPCDGSNVLDVVGDLAERGTRTPPLALSLSRTSSGTLRRLSVSAPGA
jgi:hypothetical protein